MGKKAWCEILISRKKVKIDKEDLKKVQEKSWRITEGTTGRPRVVTSMRTPKGVRSITLGRYLMKPSAKKQVYCQRFNDGLDYRKENLVVCTIQERQRLLPKRRTKTTSRYRGVSFQSKNKKWRAGIEVKGKQMNLGEFAKESQAALAYNKASEKYFGKNAYQNSINRKKTPR
jgi:hypothetical protein